LKFLTKFKQDPHLLKDKTFLITGAANGIGRAVTKAALAAGANIVLLDKDVANLKSLLHTLPKSDYNRAHVYPLDLSGASYAEYQKMVEVLIDSLSKLDGILFNAAMLGSLTPIEYYSQAIWYKVMQVNLNSSFLLSQAALHLIKKSPHGRLIFTCRAPGSKQEAFWGAYSVAMAGCYQLMRTLSEECHEHTNIRVNGIAPDKILTNLRREAFPAEDSDKLELPENIVEPYLYLLSEQSQALTGEVILPTVKDEVVTI